MASARAHATSTSRAVSFGNHPITRLNNCSNMSKNTHAFFEVKPQRTQQVTVYLSIHRLRFQLRLRTARQITVSVVILCIFFYNCFVIELCFRVQKYTNNINPQNFSLFFREKPQKLSSKWKLFIKNTTFAPELASRVLQYTPTELTLCHGGKTMWVK